MSTSKHKSPALHNAMWPGIVGKGPDSEPFIDLDTMLSLFFFPAEDGIRYLYVTGVQTCALPISIGCGSAVTLGPASVAVSPASIAQTIGATQQLTATVKDAGGNVLTGQSVTWT